MASKLPIVKAKAVEASKFLTKHGCAYYKQMLEQNKQYIQEPPTVEKCQHLAKQVFYTRLARSRDSPIGSSKKCITIGGSNTHLTASLEDPSNIIVDDLASIPGRYQAFWKELNDVKNLWKHRQELKIEDAGIAAVFGLECFAWFCAGEIVGRGFTITGYYV